MSSLMIDKAWGSKEMVTSVIEPMSILARLQKTLSHASVQARKPEHKAPASHAHKAQQVMVGCSGLKASWMVWQGDPYQAYLDSK